MSDTRRWLPPPSDTAVELIRSLLTDKENRLSSRQYRQAERGLIRRLSSSASNHQSSPLARHVYANGAEEIKSHRFFHGIPWAQMHLTLPPFVPRVKEHQSITKYFEDEKDIISDMSSSEVSLLEPENDDDGKGTADLQDEDAEQLVRLTVQREKVQLGIEHCADTELSRIKEHLGAGYEAWKAQRVVEVAEARAALAGEAMPPLSTAMPPVPQHGKAKKEKKRARDKMLRDPVVGRKVLELRKKSAFFGYTYRRPKPLPVLEQENRWSGRSCWREGVVRPTILPVERE